MISTRNSRQGFIDHLATNLIMLIEDDMDHAELTIRILEEHSIPNQVRHFLDGQSALDYLFRRNNFQDPDTNPRPEMILLDLHLPDIDGISILKAIKTSDELKMIPVIMLTTSAKESDIMSAYRNHANSYLVKPLGCEEFKELLEAVGFYWLGQNMRPRISGATGHIHWLTPHEESLE